jgi:SAM-dependent methyltransferase
MKLYNASRRSIEEFIRRVASEGFLTGNILEIGAGGAKVNRQLFSHVVRNYWPSDIAKRPGVDYALVCDARQLPFPSSSLDGVICSEVLEHIPDAAVAIAELPRIIKSRGFLVLTTPFFYPLHGDSDNEHGDYWRFTPAKLKELFQRDFLLVKESRAHLFFSGDPFVVTVLMLWMRK